MPPLLLLFVLILLLQVANSAFCSARCMQGWNGTTFTDECTDTTNLTCNSCDTTFFYLSGTECRPNNTFYRLEDTLLDPATTPLTGWISTNPTGVNSDSPTFGGDTYNVVTMEGVTALTYQLTLANNHSSLRFRFFSWFINPVNAKSMKLRINVDSYNNSHTIDTRFSQDMWTSPYYYIYTTPDIPHNGTQATVTIQLFTTASIGSYTIGLKQFMVFSRVCPNNCLDCYTKDSVVRCSQCNPNFYLYKDRCHTHCPNGTTYSGFSCTECHQSCATCSSTTSLSCTSCSQTWNRNLFLYNHTCSFVCPNKTYRSFDGFVCAPCAVGCAVCDGMQAQDCTECELDSNGTPFYLLAHGEGCYSECPPGQYKKQMIGWFTNNTCGYCDSFCATCITQPNICTSCLSNKSFEIYFFPKNKSCVKTCPHNYIIQNKTCICPSGKYQDSNLGCVFCDISCSTCDGPLHTDCFSCNPGYYLIYNTTSCKSVCPTGQFISAQENQCNMCSHLCYSCIGLLTNCTSCNNITYLFNNTCVDECPNGYGSEKYPHQCILCTNGTSSYKNKCVLKCPATFKVDSLTNSCIKQTRSQPSLLDFKILPHFINQGKQLFLNLVFKTKLTPQSDLDSNLQIYVSSIGYSRLLQIVEEPLQVTNVDYDQSLLSVKIYTNVPSSINDTENSEIVINFLNNSLQTENGSPIIQSNVLPFNNPNFIREIYTQLYHSGFDWIGIILSIIAILLVPMAYFKKFTYYPILEFIMQLQVMRLLSFTLFPVNFEVFAFLRGFDVIQFQWMPNVVISLVPITYIENSLIAYQFRSSTMNFLILAASNILFLIIFQPILIYLYCYNKQRFSKFVMWFEKTLIYLCSINILFAAWSSFVSLFINFQNNSLYFLISQLLGFVTFGIIIYFYIRQWEGFVRYKMFFLISLAFCILVPFFSKSFSLSLVILDIVVVAIIVASYRNRKKSDKRTKPLIAGRIFFLIMINIVQLGQNPTVVITLATLFFFCQLGVLSYFIYRAFIKKSTEPQQGKKISEKGGKKQIPIVKQQQQKINTVVKFADDRVPEPLMFYQQENDRSIQKKLDSPPRAIRKDSQTYYSPRKNWRNYNNIKSKTIYKEQQSLDYEQGKASEVSDSNANLEIKPLDRFKE